MTLLRSHIWLAGMIVMFVNIIIARVRMPALIADGRLTAREANRFCISAAVALAILCALFEAVTSLTGLPPECQLLLPFRRGGDETLAKVGPAFTRGDVRKKVYSPRQVRVWLTVLLVIAWGGYVAMGLVVPTSTLAEMPFCSPQVTAGEAQP
jgi:hypothetical protein